ncbi:MAG: hypothetical protein IJX77_07820 [Ruminococcus sp.]|nr:hypothetical protein [Ruminococcus sp.]
MYNGTIYPEIILLGFKRIGKRFPCIVELLDKCGYSTVTVLGEDVHPIFEEKEN